jgi:hypothetical protein
MLVDQVFGRTVEQQTRLLYQGFGLCYQDVKLHRRPSRRWPLATLTVSRGWMMRPHDNAQGMVG